MRGEAGVLTVVIPAYDEEHAIRSTIQPDRITRPGSGRDDAERR